MSNLLLLAIIAILAWYVAVPIMVRRTQRLAPKPLLRSILSDFAPPSVRATFDASAKSLESLGFLYCFDAVTYDEVSNMRIYMRGLVHRQQKIMALATALVAEEHQEQLLHAFLEMTSRFSDGTELCTYNSDLAGMPINNKRKICRGWQMIKEPKLLVRIHQFYLRKLVKKGGTPTLITEGEELSEVQNSLVTDLKEQEQMGGLFFDQDEQCYRPTWAGAFLSAWYAMWPMSFLRRFYHNQRARLWMRMYS